MDHKEKLLKSLEELKMYLEVKKDHSVTPEVALRLSEYITTVEEIIQSIK